MADKKTQPSEWAGSPSLGWWWRWGALLSATLSQVSGTTLIGLSLRFIEREDASSTPPGATWDLTPGVFLVVSGIALNIANQRKSRRHAERLERKRTKGVEAFNQPLTDIFKAFEDLLDEPEGPRASQRFHDDMVKAAAKLFPYEGVRVCVYKLETSVEVGKNGNQSKEPSETLWLQFNESGGRPDPPRTGFYPDTPFGLSAIECAQGTDAQHFHRDQQDPRVNISKSAQYESFLRVPIRSRKTARPTGLLVLDTREHVEFTDEDVAIAWNISRLLALGLDRMARAGADVRPEVEDMLTSMGYATMSDLQGTLRQEHIEEGNDE